jgi:hemerythrin HHE cation binding domain protein
LEEHDLLRDFIAQITTQPTAALLEEYATRLNDHIRYEERVLFPYMEENLSEEQLTEIGKNLSADPHTEEESYSDEFWQ